MSEEDYKQAGLAAGDKVGFFERLRMGNIDDPSSEAYRRFGAGRGRAMAVPVEDRTFTPVSQEPTVTEAVRENVGLDAIRRQEDRGYTPRISAAAPARDARDKEASMTRGIRTASLGGSGRGGQGAPTAKELAAYADMLMRRDMEADMTRGRRAEPGGSGRGGQGGPTAEELAAYLALQGSRRNLAPAAPGDEDRVLRNLRKPKASEFTGMGSLKFSKGGTVSKASKRADGIAQRGKTRGRMV